MRLREDGSASVLTVGGVLAVATVLAGVLVVVSTVRDVHRARAAADLSALAAAGPTAAGGAVDCPAGSAVAAANGAVLTGCLVRADRSVVVTVEVARSAGSSWGLLTPVVTARARAGVLQQHPP